MLNIKNHAVAATGTLELTDAAGEPLYDGDPAKGGKRCSISLYGPGSREWNAAKARMASRQLEWLRKKGKTRVSTGEQTDSRAEFLADITIAFNHFSYPCEDGASGHTMFKAAYADPEIGFVADQVDEYQGDWENFTRASAKS